MKTNEQAKPINDKQKSSFVENTYLLSSSQKVSKVTYTKDPQTDEAKAFLNSTLNVSNYNSNNNNT